MLGIIQRINDFLNPVTGTCDCGGDLRTNLDWVGPYTECDKCKKTKYLE